MLNKCLKNLLYKLLNQMNNQIKQKKKKIYQIQCKILSQMTSTILMNGNQKLNRLSLLSFIQRRSTFMTASEWILTKKTISGYWIHKHLCMPAVSVTIFTILFKGLIKYSLVGMVVESAVLQYIQVVNTTLLLKKVHSLMCTYMIYNIAYIEFWKKEQNDHIRTQGSQKMAISLPPSDPLQITRSAFGIGNNRKYF